MANPVLANGMGSPQSIYQTTTTKFHKLGTRAYMPEDGRVFRYASLAANGTALVRANLQQRRIVVVNHSNQTQATSGATLAAGATRISIDVGATDVTTDQYTDGFFQINDSVGEGFEYKIRTHSARVGAGVIVAELYDPIVIAGSTASDITLWASRWADPASSTTVSGAAGVPKVAVPLLATAAQFYWAQTWGESSILCGVAIPLGQAGIQSAATAGAVTVAAALTDQVVCQALLLTVSTEHQMVSLVIAP